MFLFVFNLEVVCYFKRSLNNNTINFAMSLDFQKLYCLYLHPQPMYAWIDRNYYKTKHTHILLLQPGRALALKQNSSFLLACKFIMQTIKLSVRYVRIKIAPTGKLCSMVKCTMMRATFCIFNSNSPCSGCSPQKYFDPSLIHKYFMNIRNQETSSGHFRLGLVSVYLQNASKAHDYNF